MALRLDLHELALDFRQSCRDTSKLARGAYLVDRIVHVREFVADAQVQQAAARGTSFGAPTELETSLAQRVAMLMAELEEKEYGEPYILEALAREMMATDPALQREFEELLATDAEFAASPYERLRFFHKRSPYWDPQMNLYPVGRIIRVFDLPLTDI